MKHPAWIGLMPALVALLAACSTALSSSATPPMSVMNGTDRSVTVLLNGSSVAELSPATEADPLALPSPPPLPWTVEVRTISGFLLATATFETASYASYRFDLSCGRIDIWSRVPVLGPMNGPGEPGDCGPPDPQPSSTNHPTAPSASPSSSTPATPSPSLQPPPASPLPSASPPPRPSLAPAVLPAGRPPRTTTRVPPRAVAHRGGLTIQVWVPKRRFGVGEWIPIHARITNGRAASLNLPCDFLIPFMEIGGLFDPGKTWQGVAAAFKAQALAESHWLNGSAIRLMTPGEEPCGAVAVPVALPGQDNLGLRLRHPAALRARLPAAAVGDVHARRDVRVPAGQRLAQRTTSCA